jgi:hypothetical protein
MPFSLGENGFSTLSSVYTITGTALVRKPNQAKRVKATSVAFTRFPFKSVGFSVTELPNLG